MASGYSRKQIQHVEHVVPIAVQRLHLAALFRFLEFEGNRELRDDRAQTSCMHQRLEAGFGFVDIFLRILDGCGGRGGRFRGRSVSEYLGELGRKSKSRIHIGNALTPTLCAGRLEWTVK